MEEVAQGHIAKESKKDLNPGWSNAVALGLATIPLSF